MKIKGISYLEKLCLRRDATLRIHCKGRGDGLVCTSTVDIGEGPMNDKILKIVFPNSDSAERKTNNVMPL